MRWDTERWRNDKESKTRPAVYNQFKRAISGEEIYVNDYNSVLLYKCRSNMLEKQICGWRCGVPGVWDGRGGYNGTFLSGVQWPVGDEWYGGGAHL